jgi:hypothetical protein
MNISDEQIDSARNGHVVRVATDAGELVILSSRLYEQITSARTNDPRETYRSVLNAWDAEGTPEDATAYKDLA